MAYRVMPVYRKDGTVGFKVAWESKKAGDPRYSFIKQNAWHTVGFTQKMTLEEAKTRAKQLNAQAKLKTDEERKVKILNRLDKEDKALLAHLPELFITEFESTVLTLETSTGKTASYWRAVKKCMVAVKLDPSEWEEKPKVFYQYFAKHHLSIAYVTKLIPLLNQWGKFLSKRTGKAFLPLPFPRGADRVMLEKAWKNRPKDRQGNKKSAPLSPQLLESKRETLDPAHYNWLLISVWFGLRPHEVDRLHLEEGGDDTWRIDDSGEIPVLWLYQTKLEITVSDEKQRWKYIPCIHPEQLRCLEIIRSGEFKQPLSKTIRAHFGDRFSAYGGRKHFTSLMKSLGQKFEDVSVWLGHKSVDRTYHDYFDKLTVTYTKIA